VGAGDRAGFCVWREIKKRGAGTLLINLDERSIVVKTLRNMRRDHSSSPRGDLRSRRA